MPNAEVTLSPFTPVLCTETGLREGCLPIPASGAHAGSVEPEVYIVEESERGGRRGLKEITIRVTTSSEPAPAPRRLQKGWAGEGPEA